MRQKYRHQRVHDQRIYSLRFWLIVLLGGVCYQRDATCDGPLEVDHINGRNWELRAVNSATRIKRLFVEADEGKLQLLCRHHNAAKQ